MATNALRYGDPIILPHEVSGADLYLGNIVRLGTEGSATVLGTVIKSTTAADNHYGIVVGSKKGAWPAEEGDEVDVALLGYGVVAVLVGSGGATIGSSLTASATGATNATTGGGTNACNTIGQCLQAGVEGDLVGCNTALASRSVSA